MDRSQFLRVFNNSSCGDVGVVAVAEVEQAESAFRKVRPVVAAVVRPRCMRSRSLLLRAELPQLPSGLAELEGLGEQSLVAAVSAEPDRLLSFHSD
jgi:hypothetical protein